MTSLLLAIIYLAFISLGLPDGLLGAAWPTMYREFAVPVSYAGVISMIISAGTVISSLQSDRLTRRFGTGMVTAVSVAMTALALFGFSVTHSFALLLLWAVPYGLGAGSVDASLNNYVALHYESRHMSWLHCMWGIGASAGPYIMAAALTGGHLWNTGYRNVGIIQAALTFLLFLSLRLWEKPDRAGKREKGADRALSIREVLCLPGAKEIMICFFSYCALEATTGLWASSYLVLHGGIDPNTAASYASLFYIGITVGRAISGFLTLRWDDTQMVRIGIGLIALGLLLLLLPLGGQFSLAGLILIGFGCAPIYPCMIHATPTHFGAARSQAVIGMQMAAAYVGTSLMPPLFGMIAGKISTALFPVYLALILALMLLMHERLVRRTGEEAPCGA